MAPIAPLLRYRRLIDASNAIGMRLTLKRCLAVGAHRLYRSFRERAALTRDER